MERRRTDRKQQLEMVLAAIFLASRAFQNTCSYRTQITSARPNNDNYLAPVNGPKVPDRALIGSQFCGNPVDIPDSVTKEIISGHDVWLGLLFAAVMRATGGVLAYLERAEHRAANRCERWEAEDYRLAQIVVLLAQEGKADPYVQAFFQLYAIHPDKVTWWWRDHQKLWQLSQATNCPSPLLVANQAEEILNSPLIIPDYDPTLQVSPVLSHSKVTPHPAKNPAPVRPNGSGDTGAGLPKSWRMD